MLSRIKPKSEFSRNVLTLMSGTALSQIIAILVLPILSRIYDPSDFGKLAVVMSISNIPGVILALRYEMAIMLPRQSKTAFLAMTQAVFLAIVLSVVEFFALAILFKFILTSYSEFLYLVVLVSFSNIIFQTSVLWFNRHKKFYLSSLFAVLKVVFIFALQFSFQSTGHGIIWGYFFGNMIILTVLLVLFLRNFIYYKNSFSKNKLCYLFKRYKKFPIYSMPASMMSSAGGNVHFILIESFFGSVATGVFSMVLRLAYAPIRLISGSINNVVYQKFTHDVVNRKPVHKNMQKLAMVMSIIGLIIATIAFIFSKFDVVTLLLGQKWSNANDMIVYFLPILAIAMVSNSIARFAIFERQEIGLYFQALLLTSVITSITLGSFFTDNFEMTVLIYALSLSLVFLLQLNISLYLAKKHDKGLK